MKIILQTFRRHPALPVALVAALTYLLIPTSRAQEDPGSAPSSPAGWEPVQAKWQPLPLAEVEAAANEGDATAQYYLGRYHADGLGGVTNQAEGLKWHRLAAGQNLPLAQRGLAARLAQGHGWGADEVEARRWLEQAAKQGDPEAQYALGHLLMSRKGVALETANARYWYSKAARQGKVEAYSELGALYLRAKIGDAEEALDWLELGAEKGQAHCRHLIGWFYLHGHGVKRDFELTRRSFQEAAEGGDVGASTDLGRLFEFEFREVEPFPGINPDYVQAGEWYRRSLASGDHRAATYLARLYLARRIQATDSEAVEWLRAGADRSDPQATAMLADFYAQNRAQPRRPEEAPLELYRQLARKNAASGFAGLARAYQTGNGVPPDLLLATAYHFQAARRGEFHAEAFQLLRLVDDAGQPRPQTDPERARLAPHVSLFIRAVRLNDPAAQLAIGEKYLAGDGLPQSDFEAYVWFSFATSKNAADAAARADKLRTRLTEEQVAETKSRLTALSFTANWLQQNH